MHGGCHSMQSHRPLAEVHLRYVSLLVLVFQFTCLVLLTSYASHRESRFHKTAAVFWNEVVKLTLVSALFAYTSASVRTAITDVRYYFTVEILDTLKVGLPALIYTIQNFLLYTALENLDATTYMVTYQLKILTTALFTVLMLKRRLSAIQWLALLVLVAGVVFAQFGANEASKQSVALNLTANSTESAAPPATIAEAQADAKPWLGLLAVIAASVGSGLAGVYFERILKGSPVSLWLRNIQLAVLALPISMIMILVNDGGALRAGNIMQGFDGVVWCVVLLQAAGGLIIAIVIKYADNILKAFATSIAIIVSSAVSFFFFHVYPQVLFVFGTVLVCGSVLLYSYFPYQAAIVDSSHAAPPPVASTSAATAPKEAVAVWNGVSLDGDVDEPVAKGSRA